MGAKESCRFVVCSAFVVLAFMVGVTSGFAGGYLQGFDEGMIAGWRYARDGNPANPPMPLAPWNQPGQ